MMFSAKSHALTILATWKQQLSLEQHVIDIITNNFEIDRSNQKLRLPRPELHAFIANQLQLGFSPFLYSLIFKCISRLNISEVNVGGYKSYVGLRAKVLSP